MLVEKSTKVNEKIKDGIFKSFSLCIENAQISSFLYLVLIIIETFVLFIPALIAIDAWNPQIQYFRDFAQYTHNSNSRNIQIFIMVVTVMVCMIGFCSVLIVCSSLYKGKRMEMSVKWIISRVFEYLIIFEKCLFYIPFSFLGLYLKGLPTYSQTREDSTWEPIYKEADLSSPSTIFLLILISLLSLSLIVVSILFSIFSLDPQPNSKKSWNSESSLTMALKYILKIYQGLILAFDAYATQNKLLFVMPPTLLLCFILILKYFHPPTHQLFFAYFSLPGQIFVTFAYSFAIAMIIKMQYKYLVPWAIIYLTFTAFYIFQLRLRNHVILEQNLISFKNPKQVRHSIVVLLRILEQFKSEDNYGKLMSLLISHYKNCSEETCGCIRILSIAPKDQYSKIMNNYEQYKDKKSLLSMNCSKLFQTPDQSLNLERDGRNSGRQDRDLILEAIESVLLEGQKKYPRDANLCSLMAYLVFYGKCHILGTLEWIEKTKILKGSIQAQFHNYYLSRQLDCHLLRGYKNVSITDRDNVETPRIIEYLKSYNKCMKAITKCANSVVIFWGNLLNEQINKDNIKLCKAGKEVVKEMQRVRKSVNKVECIYGKNNHFLLKFGHFQKSIMNNEGMAQEIFRRLKHLNEESLFIFKGENEDLLSFSHSAKMLIMIARISPGNEVTLTDMSHDLQSEFGFSKSEMKGRSLNMLLLKSFVNVHHHYIAHFLNSNNITALSAHQKPLPIQLKSSYIKMFLFNQRIIPALYYNHIQFLFSCRPYLDKSLTTTTMYLQKQCLMIFNDEGIIEGINKTCTTILKLPINSIDSGNKSVFDLIPQLHNDIFLEKIKSDNGFIFTISITRLHEQWDCQPPLELLSLNKNLSDTKNDQNLDLIMFWGKVFVEDYGYESCGKMSLSYLKFIPIIDKAEIQIIRQFMRQSVVLEKPQILQVLMENEDQEEEKEELLKENLREEGEKLTAGENENKLLFIEKKQDLEEDYNYRGINRFKTFIFLSFFTILLLAIWEFVIYLEVIKEYKHSFEVIRNAGMRYNRIITLLINNAGINMFLMNCHLLTPSKFMYEEILDHLVKQTDDLAKAQAYLDKYIFDFADYLQRIEKQDIEYSSMNQILEIYNETNPLNQAVNMIIGQQILQNSYNLSFDNICEVLQCSLNLTNCLQLFKINQMLTTNQFSTFRIILDKTLDQYIDHYFSSLKNQKLNGYILVSVCVGVMLLSIICIIGKVVSVEKGKSKAIAVFTYLTHKEINETLQNCMKFDPIHIWLDEKMINAQFLIEEHKINIRPAKKEGTGSPTHSHNEKIPEEYKNSAFDREDSDDIQKVEEFDSGSEDLEVVFEEKKQIKKHAALSKLDKSAIRKVLTKIMVSIIVLISICGINIYLLNTLYRDFTFVSEYYDDVIKRNPYLESMYFMLVVDIYSNTTDYILEDNRDEYSFNDYSNKSHKIEENLRELQKDHPSFFNHFTERMKAYNSREFCIEIKKDLPHFNVKDCKELIGKEHELGLRNLIFNYFTNFHKKRMEYLTIDRKDPTALMMAQYRPEFGNTYYPFLLYVMTDAIDSLQLIYLEDTEDYFRQKKSEKIGYFTGLIFGFVIFYLLLFYNVISSLKEDTLLHTKILNIIPIHQVFSNPKIKSQLMLHYFS